MSLRNFDILPKTFGLKSRSFLHKKTFGQKRINLTNESCQNQWIEINRNSFNWVLIKNDHKKYFLHTINFYQKKMSSKKYFHRFYVVHRSFWSVLYFILFSVYFIKS